NGKTFSIPPGFNGIDYKTNNATIKTIPELELDEDFEGVYVRFVESDNNEVAIEYFLPTIAHLRAMLSLASVDLSLLNTIIDGCVNFISNNTPSSDNEGKFEAALQMLKAEQLASIDIDKSLAIINQLTTGGLYKEEELICLNLLGTYTSSSTLLEKLKTSQYQGLIKKLDDGFDDTFGDDNYSALALVLNSHVLAAKASEISNKQAFIEKAQNESKAYRYYANFSSAESKPCRSKLNETNSNVTYTIRTAVNSRNDVWEDLSPYAWDELVALYSEKDVTALGITKNNFEIMPAYLYHSIIQQEHNELMKDGLMFTINMASMGIGLGEIAAGVRGMRMVFAYCDVAASLVDIGINAYEKQILDKFGEEEGQKFIAAINKISVLVALGDIGTATLARLGKVAANEVKYIAEFYNNNADELKAISPELETGARKVAALEDDANWEALAKGEDVAGTTTASSRFAALVKAAQDKFGKAAIANEPDAFIDNIESIVTSNGWTMETFKRLMNKRIIDLTPEEISTITKIREVLPGITQNTICQKVLTENAATRFMGNNEGAEISGSIARAQDTKHLNTVEKIYYGLRLDYSSSPFASTDDFVYVIRYTSSTPSNARISNTVDLLNKNSYPYTGNGFTAGTEGADGVMGSPEYFVDFTSKMQMTDAAIFRVYKDGSEEVVSALDIVEGELKFVNKVE
ncbi:MAG: hypothetical protein HC831_29890, partial [Chloroflexia bacterium]|nr:hypothetical protein [Chloroflexia bacterium]